VRENINERFITLTHYTSPSQSRSIIFLEGPKGDWFGVAKLLKVLIEGHKSLLSEQEVTPQTSSLRVSSHLSFVEVEKDVKLATRKVLI